MEILSPAGSPEGLAAAVMGGCDAVYLGGKSFGARAFSSNFTDGQIEGAVGYCHDRGVKVYVTVNTLIKDSEMDDAASFVRFLADIGADGVLLQDLGLLRALHSVDIPKHASTQMGICSRRGLQWCAENGLSRAVLNRELTFEELKDIVRDSPVETEVFVQGALCYCLSGGCLFSSLVGGRSGNRGQCAQPCRKKYAMDGKASYRLSSADLYGVEWLKKLESIGITSAKIEGRMRSQAYAYLSAKVYSSANRGIPYEEWKEDDELLKTVFNRGYCDGYLGGVVSPVQQEYADNRGFYLGKASFRGRKFSTGELRYPVNVRDGISIYDGDEKIGGFKLTSVGRAASPFALPDGTYDVYRTYDPRIDEVKNMIGEAPKLSGSTERRRAHVPCGEIERAKKELPEMSFYVSSVRNLNAVLPYADRIYYDNPQSLDEARGICAGEGIECVEMAPRFDPAWMPHDGPYMANTPGQVFGTEDHVYASYFMNVFNAHARMPFWQTTLSTELADREIEEIAKHFPGRLEVMVFGRTELMCTRDPGLRTGVLEDEKGYRFPVYRDPYGTARILNSSDLMLLPYLRQLGSFGIDSAGIDVRKRPERIAAAVAKAFAEDDVPAKKDLAGICGGINYGAYLRGTE